MTQIIYDFEAYGEFVDRLGRGLADPGARRGSCR